MKRWLLIAAMLACSVGTASAQGVAVTANLTAQDSGACTTANACLVGNVAQGYASSVIQLSGTWSGTAQFEAATTLNGPFTAIAGIPVSAPSNSAVTSSAANGAWRFNVSSVNFIRVRVSAYSSGTVAAAISVSPATSYSGSSSGNDGSGVSSFSGDGAFACNNTSTGAVTLALCTDPVLPNGTTATTQTAGDDTSKVATDAFVLANQEPFGGITNTGPLPLVLNGNFESDSTLPPPGWDPNSNATLSYETVSPYEGAQTLKMVDTGGGGGAGVFSNNTTDVLPGDVITIAGAVKASGGVTANLTIQFISATGAGAIGPGCGVISSSATYVYSSATCTVPAGASFAEVEITSSPSSAGGTTWYDAISVYKISNPGWQQIDLSAYVGTSGDQTAGVQAAVNALPNGGTIYVPPTLSSVLINSGPVTFPIANAPIIVKCGGAGYAQAATFFNVSTATYMFRVGNINNGSARQSGVLFQDCGFQDSSVAHNTALGGIYFTDVNNSGAERNTFANFNRPPIATPSAPTIAVGSGATSYWVQIVCTTDMGGHTIYSPEGTATSGSTTLTVTAPTSSGCPAPSSGYLVLASTTATGLETLQAASGCTLNATGTACGLTNNWSGSVTSGNLKEGFFKYDTSAGAPFIIDGQTGANGTPQDASYGHFDDNLFQNNQECMIFNGGISEAQNNHLSGCVVYGLLTNLQNAQVYSDAMSIEIPDTTTARGVILNGTSPSHIVAKFEGHTNGNTDITCAEVNSSRNYIGGNWLKCGVALIQQNAGFDGNTYDIHSQISNLASPLISGRTTNDIVWGDTSNNGSGTFIPQLTIAGISASPSPICPNGSGGQLTTSGCTSAGGIGYPGAGVANSTGSAWGTSYAVGTAASNLVQLNGASQLPAVSAANLTNFPTLNQNTTGTAANLSGTPTLPNGTAAFTQGAGDATTKLATDSFVSTAVGNAIPLALFTNKNLASPVSVTGSTLTTVDSVSATMPSTGGPYRVLVTYTYFNSGGVNVECYVTDGTNNWALWEQATTSNITTCVGSQWSPTTYAAGATPTFTVKEYNTGSATVETVGNLTGSVPSSMQISIFASN